MTNMEVYTAIPLIPGPWGSHSANEHLDRFRTRNARVLVKLLLIALVLMTIVAFFIHNITQKRHIHDKTGLKSLRGHTRHGHELGYGHYDADDLSGEELDMLLGLSPDELMVATEEIEEEEKFDIEPIN
mmetsp:Transcript_17176/g.24988  ORF Transcript_17176/g.24988 Transcript_17176/m.24988 type:complete len:129 (-) Transcript_17176:371-757(-)|eukprot:CAMPEP_0197243230 /NCGR_PEP_ID=MMETSP1429-20130617/8741_1 /TAXON_ID=49237 /ORGANISM="Chaetoceros  sp., Strain UNC1202" /LENGTH=128 /DNA_ID=CAMNT_0042703407 /DNA_START=107 /DNA_END=493 /DNA_ORIENTATION=-